MPNQDFSQRNKRIAKNTLFLYFRMIFAMIVNLYTSRVILNSLGIDDYGTYNVVGGVVAMFTLFTNSLSQSISRFLTYSLGKGDSQRLIVVFSTSVSIQLCMSVVIAVLLEIVGLFLLNNYLNIPIGRLDAAKWVLHFSIVSFVINLISVPYNAMIIAHERMSFFAFVSILETLLKLGAAYLIYISPMDKIIFYAVLLTSIAAIIRLIYGVFCRINFSECKYNMVLDKNLLKQMFGFTSWSMLGTGAYLFNTQGVNLITNVFFGVGTNAARGISTQVEHAARQLATNFTTAINPQITKSYAEGNLDYMHSLVCKGAKFSYMLMLFIVVPFLFESEQILSLWLKNYPSEASIFIRIALIGNLFDILGNSTAHAAWATGNVKRYYILVAGIGCLVFPISFACFYLGFLAYTSYIVFALIYLILIFVKVYIIRGLVMFSPRRFFVDVLARIVPTTMACLIFPAAIYIYMPPSLTRFVLVVLVSVCSVALSIFVFGLTKGEKSTIISYVNKKVRVCQ